jgi:hypothetical protein
LLREPIIIEAVYKLFKELDEGTANKLHEKNTTIQSFLTNEEQKYQVPSSLNSNTSKYFKGSKCANQNEIDQILLFLKDMEVYETVLEYRGSDHGWTGEDFHKRANNKGWTVSLFKILDGDCVGGFTT